MNLRKYYSITIIVFVLLISSIIPFSQAMAEKMEWVCLSCGYKNHSNYCAVCGASKPQLWICDNCHAPNNMNFCTECGTSQSNNYAYVLTMCDSSSMADHYLEGDYLAFSKINPDSLKRFDVVSWIYPGRESEPYTARIVGFPGDRLKIEDGYLYVNGKKHEEPYINNDYRVNGAYNGLTFAEVIIPKAGDLLRLDYLDEDKKRIGLFVNDNVWTWRGISSEAVSMEGERLSYNQNGVLTLNGMDISNNLDIIVSLIGKEFQLESGLYFVMGDHRNYSYDSREYGPIQLSMIQGLLVGHWRLDPSTEEMQWIEP